MTMDVTGPSSCECCHKPGAKTRGGVATWEGSEHQAVKANLCNACATDGQTSSGCSNPDVGAPCSPKQHYAGRCKVAVTEGLEVRQCGVVVWECAQGAHASLFHATLLGKRANMPDVAPVEPRFRHLGTINPDN